MLQPRPSGVKYYDSDSEDEPEENEDGLRKNDIMVAQLNVKNIDLAKYKQMN